VFFYLKLNSISQIVANIVDERLRLTTEYQVVSNFPNFVVFENPQAASKVIIMNKAQTPSPESCMWRNFLYIVQRQLSSADVFSHQEVPLSHIAVTISTTY
jgi:hypothetical protein